MSDIAVSVRGLSKAYTIAHQGEKHVTLAESLLAKARRPFARTPTETFWVLTDVEFDIKKGGVVGIIGRNGAGKSTLLKILSRITEPTTGQIDLYGRVGSLLEVGTGFHPELTGRENIFLNGAILGMTKAEIRKQFDAIVDFAGVEQFLDTPVKRYSSGMYVRLAFAVAANLESEVLIVDEVLAVGDADFQRKCIKKMQQLAGGGRTVLFVSHNMTSVAHLCDELLVLVGGAVAFHGDVEAGIVRYLDQGISSGEVDLRNSGTRTRVSSLIVKHITTSGSVSGISSVFQPEEEVAFKFHLESVVRLTDPRISVGIDSALGGRLFVVGTELSSDKIETFKGSAVIETRFRLPSLAPGSYTAHVGITEGPMAFIDAIPDAFTFRIAETNYSGSSTPYRPEHGQILVKSSWNKQ